jgi:hypothetical protein
MANEVVRVEIDKDVYFWRHPVGEDRCRITAHGGLLLRRCRKAARPATVPPSWTAGVAWLTEEKDQLC